MAGGFEANTRHKRLPLQAIVKPTAGGLTSFELPKAGLLARLYLAIRITTAGTITTQNPLGACSAIRRVRLRTNNGIDIFNISGAGWHYLLQKHLELQRTPAATPQNQGNTVLVTATTYNLDLVVPVMLNLRDPVGLIQLQSEQLQVVLEIEWEADANVILTGGGTYTGTCTPLIEFFTTPPDPKDWPRLDLVHQIVEDQIAIAATGDYIYSPPRGNIYLQMLFGYGILAAAVDNWTRMIVRINQGDNIYDYVPNAIGEVVGYIEGYTRGLGEIAVDLLGSDGFGNYGSARDFINSRLLTDFQVVTTASATGTLYVVRRMIVPLEG